MPANPIRSMAPFGVNSLPSDIYVMLDTTSSGSKFSGTVELALTAAEKYAAGLEIHCPGGACAKLGHAIPSSTGLSKANATGM